jgi:transcriptional regulator with XRE-family HTH domain
MMYSIQGIAKSIKVARNKKGLSQRALSAKTGVPQSHIEISRALDLELVLVSTTLLPAVEALHSSMNSGQVPAYRLTDEEGNEND